MSDSVRPHRQQPTRLSRPWDSPGKNTGVGCHFLLQCMKVKSQSEVAQSCLTLHDPMDCSPPGSSVHGIFHSFTWMDILQYLSTKPQPVSVHWMGIPLNISTLPLVSFNWVYIPGYLSTRPLPVSFNGRRQVPTYLFIYLLPNKTQDHQPT